MTPTGPKEADELLTQFLLSSKGRRVTDITPERGTLLFQQAPEVIPTRYPRDASAAETLVAEVTENNAPSISTQRAVDLIVFVLVELPVVILPVAVLQEVGYKL